MVSPVTDPSIIAQLEGSNAGNNQPVSDPNLLKQLESPSQSYGYRSPEYSVGGVVGNAFQEAGNVGRTIFNNAKDVPQLAQDFYQTGKQLPSIFSGKTNVMDTPMGNRMIDSAANAMPMAQNMKTSAQHPVDFAYQHPIATGMALYGGYNAARGMTAEAPAALASERGAVTLGGSPEPPPNPASPLSTPPPVGEPNYLEKMGGANLNSGMGIRGSTVQSLTPRGVNPGARGIQLAQQLQEAGVPNEGMGAWDSINKYAEQGGHEVNQAVQAIRDAGTQVEGYSEMTDPTKLEANSTLKPILDDANKLSKVDAYPEERMVGRYLKKAYNNLANAANENDGNLSLDMVRSELKKVGRLYTPANEAIIDKVYARLADLQDHIVSNIADAAGDPSLRDNLLSANKKYSMYIRLLPDVARKSAMESVGQKTLSGIGEDIKNSIFSKGASKTGQALKGIGPAIKGARVPLFTKGSFAKPEE